MAKNTVSPALRSIQGKVVPDSIFRVPPSLLQIEAGYNIRTFSPDTNPAHAELLASISVIGVRTAIVVRMVNEKPTIVQGHMRHAAVLMHNAIDGLPDTSKILTIPAQLANAADTVADRTLDLLTSNSGIPLTQIERGHAVSRLRALDWADGDICAKAGLTLRVLQEAVKLAKSDPAIVKLVKGYVTGIRNAAGKPIVVSVSDTLATQTMTVAGPDAPAVLVEAARLAEAEAPAATARGSSKAGKIVSRHVAAASETIAKIKGTPLLTGKGVASTKGSGVKAKGLTGPAAKVNPAAVDAALARNVKPATVAKGKSVSLMGPFSCKSDGDIVDDAGELIATAVSLEHGNEIAKYLNFAYSNFAAEKLASDGLLDVRNATRPLTGVAGAKATTTTPNKGNSKPEARAAA